MDARCLFSFCVEFHGIPYVFISCITGSIDNNQMFHLERCDDVLVLLYEKVYFFAFFLFLYPHHLLKMNFTRKIQKPRLIKQRIKIKFKTKNVICLSFRDIHKHISYNNSESVGFFYFKMSFESYLFCIENYNHTLEIYLNHI